MHTIVNYPSDTNRITKLVMPEGDLNGSAAALNASIKALTDAITAAQAVLATLVPYTGATANVNLGAHNLTVGGIASIDDGKITLGAGGTGAVSLSSGFVTTDSGGSLSADSGAIVLGAPYSRSSGIAFFDNNLISTNGDGTAYFDGEAILLGTSGSPGTGAVVFDNGAVATDGRGNLTTGSLILANTTTPPSPVAGQIYFDGTHFLGYNGSTWKQLDN